jgi:thioredoxin 1
MISEQVREVDTVGVAEIVAAAPGVVIVDCWAEWCGPCHLLAPILDDMASDDPALTIVKVNVEEHPEFSRLYDVMSFPTLLFFRDRQLVQRLIGARPRAALAAEVARIRNATP